ncbi:MAG: C13 family peptidase, partial [Noviherbaspirillum sp.]
MTEQNTFANEEARQRPLAALGRWYVEGGRGALLLAPRWQRLRATPAVVAMLTVAGVVLTLLVERLYIEGPATFYWEAVLGGWFVTAITAWVCYLLRPQPLPENVRAPSAAHLFCMLLAQAQVITLLAGTAFALLVRKGWYLPQTLGTAGMWMLWSLPLAWLLLAQIAQLSRTRGRAGAMFVAALTLTVATTLHYLVRQDDYWQAVEQPGAQAEGRQFNLTQDVMEMQQQLLAQRLQEIRRQRPGVIDLYAISFAPYADEDVFRRESAMVTEVMAQRFDAAGRTLQLVNHPDTAVQWPWATPKNLQRAIQRVAALMDRDEDVLFLHLTSHGARDGELAAHFWPIAMDTVKPADLKAWLHQAGIKYRVISISACYSGSWIDPLAGEHTVVMTAADADHTSYGCG